MTSLKNYSGDEIAAALAEQLSDEKFVGLYRKAEDAWWTKGPTAAAFKQEVDASRTAGEVDAVRNKYLAGGTLTSALGAEGVDDFQPLIEYANDKAASMTQAADDAWWAKGPTAAAFKREVDAAQSADQVTAARNKYLAAGSPLAGKLGAEGIDDFQPLIEYANDKAATFEYAADDKPKIPKATGDPIQGLEMTEKEISELTGVKPQIKTEVDVEELMKAKPPAADDKPCGCPAGAACDHGAVSAAAVNFANRHLAKIASALDVAGFTGMADEIDGLMSKFAAKKKKKKDEEEKEEKNGKEEKEEKKGKKKGKKKKEEEEEQAAKDGGKKKKGK